MASHAADEAPLAFSHLFVKTDWRPELQALRSARTPRPQNETALQAAHFVARVEGARLGLRCQTNRAKWLLWVHMPGQPLAQLDAVPLEPTHLDTGLTPLPVLRVRLLISPGAKTNVSFASAASEDPETLLAIPDQYRQPSPAAWSALR